MENSSTIFTQVLETSKRIVTPIRLINTISRREVLADALWDTGAEVSAISTDTATYLQLPITVQRNSVQGVGGKTKGRAVLTIAMPGNCGQATIVEAFEANHLPSHIAFIIGMDIISQGDFSLTVTNGTMELRFAFGPKFIHLDI